MADGQFVSPEQLQDGTYEVPRFDVAPVITNPPQSVVSLVPGQETTPVATAEQAPLTPEQEAYIATQLGYISDLVISQRELTAAAEEPRQLAA